MATQDVIYKITTMQAWGDAVARGAFLGSADDERDGFIHLSSADQVAATAAKYFRGAPDLVLVAIETRAAGDVRWEASRDGALFPHIYGTLPVAAARWVRPLPLDADGIPQTADVLDT
jgi:uncharacterized protein (DUF952 family)